MIGSLQSHAELAFRFDEKQERTVLARREAGGLCHISKPFWDGGTLGLQLVNPTAGLFAGDSLDLTVKVGRGASVALTSPSAARYHTMPEGRAHLVQRFEVGHGGWLDYWPEMIIPQRDSDVVQTTMVKLEAQAAMVFLDQLAPGRVAHGERFQFRRLETRFDLLQEGRPLVKERCVLEPHKSLWPMCVPGWGCCYYAALWIVSEGAAEGLERLLSDTGEDESETRVGGSLLDENLAVLRALAPSSPALRRIIQQWREGLRPVLPQMKTDFRKL